MRPLILVFIASLGLAACGHDDAKTVVVQPQQQPTTVIVPQGATVICPNGSTAIYSAGAYRC